MSSEEDLLNALYSQRQELLKQLTEVDANIKALEAQVQEKHAHAANGLAADAQAIDTNVGKIHALIIRSMQSSNGLRDTLKVVDACRTIQEITVADRAADDPKYQFRNLFVQEVIACAHELSVNPNGSEVVHQVISILSAGGVSNSNRASTNGYAAPRSELLELIRHMEGTMTEVCCSTSGARVSQRIVDSLSSIDEFELFLQAISPSVVELAKDINGNHTLAKLMASARFKHLSHEFGSSEDRQRVGSMQRIVYEAIERDCIEICRNRQGCCIIQKCLQWAPEPYHTSIINKVLSSALKLVRDPFGNYVIQFILDKQREIGGGYCRGDDAEAHAPNYTNQIIRQMLHHVAELSCNKFSSNVIEKCLKTASLDVRQLLVDELTEPQALPKLLTDSYANYVIQTAIATASDEAQFVQLRDSILPLQDLLKNSPYGVRIETKLSRRHREVARKQSKRKENVSLTALPIHQDGPMGAKFIPNMSTTIQVMPSDGSVGQHMAFANVPPDMASLLHQRQQQMMNSMPFMLQGPQRVIGIHSTQPTPPYSAVNMINSHGNNRAPPEYF